MPALASLRGIDLSSEGASRSMVFHLRFTVAKQISGSQGQVAQASSSSSWIASAARAFSSTLQPDVGCGRDLPEAWCSAFSVFCGTTASSFWLEASCRAGGRRDLVQRPKMNMPRSAMT